MDNKLIPIVMGGLFVLGMIVGLSAKFIKPADEPQKDKSVSCRIKDDMSAYALVSWKPNSNDIAIHEKSISYSEPDYSIFPNNSSTGFTVLDIKKNTIVAVYANCSSTY